eukprot:7716721-Heterocapsa_arctica.AAC.1
MEEVVLRDRLAETRPGPQSDVDARGDRGTVECEDMFGLALLDAPASGSSGCTGFGCAWPLDLDCHAFGVVVRERDLSNEDSSACLQHDLANTEVVDLVAAKRLRVFPRASVVAVFETVHTCQPCGLEPA